MLLQHVTASPAKKMAGTVRLGNHVRTALSSTRSAVPSWQRRKSLRPKPANWQWSLSVRRIKTTKTQLQLFKQRRMMPQLHEPSWHMRGRLLPDFRNSLLSRWHNCQSHRGSCWLRKTAACCNCRSRLTNYSMTSLHSPLALPRQLTYRQDCSKLSRDNLPRRVLYSRVSMQTWLNQPKYNGLWQSWDPYKAIWATSRKLY